MGVDIGGSSIRAGLIPVESGPPVGWKVRSTPQSGDEDEVAAALAETVQGTLEAGRADRREAGAVRDTVVLGVGIGATGLVDGERGVLVENSRLGWTQMPLSDAVVSRTGLPCTLENDANAAALGEWWRGAGRGSKCLLCLTLGTGVGGGLVWAGQPFRGARGLACEMGHICLDPGGRQCGCGARGCLEAYVSGDAIAARAAEVIGPVGGGFGGTEGEEAGGGPIVLTARRVVRRARRGDPACKLLVQETGEVLGLGLASLISALNPDRVVIAGRVARAGDLLLAPTREVVRQRVMEPMRRGLEIVTGHLGNQAGSVGAAGAFLLAERQGEGIGAPPEGPRVA